jgi:hypothetical protein
MKKITFYKEFNNSININDYVDLIVKNSMIESVKLIIKDIQPRINLSEMDKEKITVSYGLYYLNENDYKELHNLIMRNNHYLDIKDSKRIKELISVS